MAYLRSHPHLVPTFLEHQRIRMTPVSGGSICTAQRLTLDDGSDVFAKSWAGSEGTTPAGFFAAEAAGLRWLHEAAAVPVPEVLAVTDDLLILEWIPPASATPEAADQFGRDLAALHRAGAARLGAPWPGYIGSLPLDNTPLPSVAQAEAAVGWPEWFAERRLLPYLRMSVDNAALDAGSAQAVSAVVDRIMSLAGPPEPPSRLHGDLWPGNVLWGRHDGQPRAWLIDPAAHGGHRETDLAFLALFGGLPHLGRVLAAYQEVHPLADGWRERVPLHQLHLLLVHTALFGSGYCGAVVAAARELA